MPNFDPKCYDLAEHFLSSTAFSSETFIAELASLLQETIEDYIKEVEEELEKENEDDE